MSIRVFLIHASDLTWDDAELLGRLSKTGTVAVNGIVRQCDKKTYLKIEVLKESSALDRIRALRFNEYTAKWKASAPSTQRNQRSA